MSYIHFQILTDARDATYRVYFFNSSLFEFSKIDFFKFFENHPTVRVGQVISSDHLSQGFKIPPGALGTIPESCRPVQVQEQVAKKTPVYTLN